MELKNGIITTSGSSGSGKTTIAKKILELRPDIMFSISTTTREIRDGEIDGVDYFFVSEEEFLRRIDEGYFVEFVTPKKSQSGSYYGTSKKEIERIDNLGKYSLLDVDLMGSEFVKILYETKSFCNYIFANNIDRHRWLTERDGEKDPKTLLDRLEKGDIQDFRAEHESKGLIDFSIQNEEGQLDLVVDKILQKIDYFIQHRTGILSLNGV